MTTGKKIRFLSGACALFSVLTLAACGENQEKHIHAWYGQVSVEATCEESGLKEYRCACGDSRTMKIDPLGHDMQPAAGIAPTCLENGITAGETCARCGKTTVQTIAAVGHTSEIVQGRAPSCEGEGLSDGEQCAVCYVTLVEQKTIPAVGHRWTEDETTDAGTVYHCQNCGERTIEKPEEHQHVYDEIASETLPSCEEDGERIRRCKCGETYTEAIAAVGHKPIRLEGQSPTCTEDGTTGGEKCENCEEMLTTPTVIPAVGHSWNNGVAVGNGVEYTCENCGETRIETVAHTHVFDEVIKNTLPTCETEGERVLGCACGTMQTEVIAAVGHKPVSMEIKQPTCTEEGATGGEKCENCEKILTMPTAIPAVGHSWGDGVYENGEIKYTCGNCGEVNTETHSEHDYATVIEENAPSCEKAGTRVSQCKCGETDTKTLAPIGHQAENVSGKAATCVETGLTDGKICTVCGVTLVAQEVIPTIEHTVVNGQCQTCGQTFAEELPAQELEYVLKSDGYYVTGVKTGETARKIVIPDTYNGKAVTGIENNAFALCYTLNSVTLGKNINNLGESTFAECHNLVEVYNYSKLSIAKGDMTNFSFIGTYAKDVYTQETESKIKVSNGFITHVNGDEVTLIGYMGTATELTLPEGITNIQKNVFSTCIGLKKVVIADTVKTLGGRVFENCHSLQSVTIGSGVTVIERYAFNNVPNLEEIYFKVTSGWTLGGDTAVSTATLQSATNAAAYVLEHYNKTLSRE